MQILNPQVIENLGQINLLLTDKTGTLTVGKMKLKNIWMKGKEWPLFLGAERGEADIIEKNSQIDENEDANEAFDSEDWADDEPRVINSKIKEGKESLDKNAAIKAHLAN